MFECLRAYYDEFSTATVSDVLGDIQPAYGGQSSDPAAWSDFQRAVGRVRQNG